MAHENEHKITSPEIIGDAEIRTSLQEFCINDLPRSSNDRIDRCRSLINESIRNFLHMNTNITLETYREFLASWCKTLEEAGIVIRQSMALYPDEFIEKLNVYYTEDEQTQTDILFHKYFIKPFLSEQSMLVKKNHRSNCNGDVNTIHDIIVQLRKLDFV